ncbi:hypothetical protein [Crateriforma conspicua]|uniref:Uncharacterized protein n=1 Tax=Crateriforma conspicua TaxID=2527996 RepID=A0A5C5Y920_9PLAN|nr:hypothetical protein [Crateriforma conspicua]QDV64464.1 hypothetical protein Mal65_36230 [Crateriforma conspicua]TWT69862.1 hypothetical protein Pan14r_21580 [Crateriforma conspicua]
MWNLIDPGVGIWNATDAEIRVQAAGGGQAVSVHCGGQQAVRLQAVGDDQFPELGESFVRGDQWHLWFPQGQGSYSLRLVLHPFTDRAGGLVIDTTVSIETTLLDSHPTIDLVATGDGLSAETFPAEAEWSRQSGHSSGPGAACVTSVFGPSLATSVLLGRRDYPFTMDLSDDAEMRLRLFGEFLEKGVIRRARPWIRIDQQTGPLDDDLIAQLWDQLQGSPLPLAS